MRVLPAVLVLVSTAAWPCAPAPQLFEIDFMNGTQVEQVAQLEKALKHGQYDRVMLLAPRFRDESGQFQAQRRRMHELEALALIKLGQFGPAVTKLDALLYRPDAFLEMKRAEAKVRWAERSETVDEAAVAILRKAARAGTLDLDARLALARDAIRGKRPDEAKRLCDEARKVAPTDHPETTQVCQGLLPAMEAQPLHRPKPCS
jgi:hypothetical protein